MSKMVVSILVSQCISAADIDAANNSTNVRACPDTVKIEEIVAPRQLRYGRYQHNAFALMKVIFGGKQK